MKNLLIAALLLALLSSCAGASQTQRRTYHEILNNVTAVAQPTYEGFVETCDAMRDAIIARDGTSWMQDRRAMDQVHEVCDRGVAGFEILRDAQMTARDFINSSATEAAVQAVLRAVESWDDLRALIPELDRLGVLMDRVPGANEHTEGGE